MDLATNQALVIIVSQDAHRYKGQSEFINKVIEVAQGVIVIGARTPYELNSFPDVPTYLAVYNNRSIVWKSVVKVLTGQLSAQGKLPVSI